MFNFGFLLDSDSGSSGIPMLVITIVAILAIWFFLFRPQQKREKEEAAKRDAMIESLVPGDEVTTIGGIIGKVVSVKEETFVLETTKDKTKIRFLKGAIRTVDVKIADIVAAQNAEKEAAAANENDGQNTAENNEEVK